MGDASCVCSQILGGHINTQSPRALLLVRCCLQVTELGRIVPAGGAKRALYCHLACALWVPEIELADPERMAGVQLGKLTAARVKLKCELCKQAGGGAS